MNSKCQQTLSFITFLINSRYILLGASLVPYLKHHPNRKVFPALFLWSMKAGP